MKADVRTVGPPRLPKADVVAALNFSALVLHERRDMFDYLRRVRDGLRAGGRLRHERLRRPPRDAAVGAATNDPQKGALRDRAGSPAFEYVWQQRSFDALTARLDCRLHFVLREGGRKRTLRNAFR